MHWTIGIDIGALDRGAVAFARWLKAQSETQRFDGVHATVLPGGFALNTLDPECGGLVSRAALEGASDVLTKLSADPVFERVDLVDTVEPAKRLASEAEKHGSVGIIVGNSKYFPSSRRTHLGSIARKLLRQLSRPTCVVPSDLTEVGSGPVLLATDFSSASGNAAVLAKTLSKDLGRELEVVHVRESSDYLDIYLSPADHKIVVDQAEEHNQERMSEWLEAHNLTDVTPRVLEGANVVTTLHDHVEKVSAAMVVVGSRQLSVVDRIFDSSVASHLAAHAPTAVLVVPPA